jgi:hypothetical protein
VPWNGLALLQMSAHQIGDIEYELPTKDGRGGGGVAAWEWPEGVRQPDEDTDRYDVVTGSDQIRKLLV